jgi:hypothetical protein
MLITECILEQCYKQEPSADLGIAINDNEVAYRLARVD